MKLTAIYKGKPLSEMSKDELIEVINEMNKAIELERKEKSKRLQGLFQPARTRCPHG